MSECDECGAVVDSFDYGRMRYATGAAACSVPVDVCPECEAVQGLG